MFDRINITLAAADDACGVCGFWKCRCGGVALAVTMAAPGDSDTDMDEALRRVRAGK